jgi:long-chain acyl-CoA synthetase
MPQIQGSPRHALDTPGKTAVIDGDRTRTYADLDQRATALGRALVERGADEQGRVAVMLPNSLETVECMAAAARCHAAYAPVNWHLRAEELGYILQDSGAQVLVTHPELRATAEAALVGTDTQVLYTGAGGSYELAIANSGTDAVPFADAWASHTWVIYTSGTTGRPKGVIHEHLASGGAALSQQYLVDLWGYRPDDVYITSGPLYHTGPAGYASTTLFAGGTVVILPWFEARAWMRLVDRHRVTTTFAAPAHFIRLLEVPEDERARYDLSSLRHVIHAGAPCPQAVKRRIIDALPDAEIWELYGASEGGATRISPQDWLARPGSVGQPWPGTEVRILDPETRSPKPVGETGVIWTVPPGGNRFRYHGDPDKTASAWAAGDAFTVGDMGHLDADGYLYVTDRLADMVIRGGANIYPREIEEVLHQHPAVVDCAVFGIPDERDGEHVKAVVELRPNAAAAISAEMLEAFCKERLATYKCPQEWDLVDELPRDPNGKVLKRLLRDAHWKGRERAV